MKAPAQSAAVGLLASALALHPILTPDLWWHLASGRWILANRVVPRTDVLSYTMLDHEWTNLQWLTDVLFLKGWEWAGPAGLVLGKALLLALTAVLLVRAGCAASAAPAAAGASAILAVLAGAERTLVRPEIFSGLLLATTLWLLYRGWAGRRRGLWFLPAVCLLWANLHALAFLGPATILLHALVAWADEGLPNRWQHGVPVGLPRDLFLVGGISALALLANPYGIAAWTFPLTLFQRIDGDVEIFSRILEFARPLSTPSDPALRFYWISIAALVTSFGVLFPRIPPARLGLVMPFLALSLLARRNVPLFAIAMAPVLARNLTDAWAQRPGRARSGRLAWIPPVVAVLLSFAILAGASPKLFGLWRDRGVFVTPGLFPEECLVALDRSGARGNVFHDLDFGGYLVWRDPDRKCFIDGRLEVAGADWFARYVEVHESPAAWQRLQRSWGLEVLLLQHAARGSAAFLRALLAGGEWTPLCFSPEAALLVRAPPETSRRPRLRPTSDDWDRILEQPRGPAPGAGRALSSVGELVDWLIAPRVPQAVVRRAVHLANLCLTLDWIDEARTGYESVLRVAPDDPEALFNLGNCDLKSGRPDLARARWEDALTRVDRASREILRDALARLEERAPAR